MIDYKIINMKTIRLLSALMLLAIIIWGCKKDDENRPPSKPKLLQPAKDAVVAPDKITFKWEESIDAEGEDIYYVIFLSSDSLVWSAMTYSNPSGTEIVNNLEGYYYFPFEFGKKYYWKVVAESHSGGGTTGTSESDVVSFYTYPTGVADLVKVSGDGYVNLTWIDPPGLSKVEITFTPAVNGITQPITVNPGIGKLELQGMANSTVYSFYVKAFNGIGLASKVDTIKAMPLAPTLVHDVEFNIYSTVQIGNQTWLRENLRATRWQNGNEMKSQSGNKYYRIGSKSDMYGYYYSAPANWEGNNPCPCGYHVPSNEEMNTLERFLGIPEADINSSSDFRGANENIGKVLKSTSGWADYNGVSGNGTDIYGFNLLPAGLIYSGAEDNIGVSGSLWTTSGSIVRHFTNESTGILIRYGSSGYFSIRCVKN